MCSDKSSCYFIFCIGIVTKMSVTKMPTNARKSLSAVLLASDGIWQPSAWYGEYRVVNESTF